MKRYSIIFIAAVMAFVSCIEDPQSGERQEEQEGQVEQVQMRDVIIDVAGTKTAINVENQVIWEPGDKITLLFSHPDNGVYVSDPFETEISNTSAYAAFIGKIPETVSGANGYDKTIKAVYPSGAIKEDGTVEFLLPSEQIADEDGSFATGINLTSAAMPSGLDSLEKNGHITNAIFRNAMTFFKFKLSSDVTDFTLEGTSPLTGMAPLVFNEDGILVVSDEGTWTDGSNSVTLKPADGEVFDDDVVYHLLVWPGTHNSLKLTLNFKDYGSYVKKATFDSPRTFKRSALYTLNFEYNVEDAVGEVDEYVDTVGTTVPSLEELKELMSAAEGQILSQIQSVALMTEYLDNSAYAPYSQLSYSKLKREIKLNYIIRPASAASKLVDYYNNAPAESAPISALVRYRGASGEDDEYATLPLKEVELNDDVLSVSVDASELSDGFYNGDMDADLALQISDGNTEILSDFASLVPKQSALLSVTKTDGIPVLKGAGMAMSFSYGATDKNACKVTVENATGFASTPTVSYNNASGTGYFRADFAENADLSAMSVDLVLTCGDESDRQTLTFADGGDFVVETSGDVDYIGGEWSMNVVSNSFGAVTSELTNAGDWIYQTYVGSNNILTVNTNSGEARSAQVVFTISNTGGISYTKSVSVNQKANNSSIDESRYHQTKGQLELQAATAGYTPLNIVIIGDGYQKKDLLKGGKFERSARSAMEAFFGVEPYKSFRDRFRVIMVAYESTDEGLSKCEKDDQGKYKEPPKEGEEGKKDTYFNSYYRDAGDTYVNLPDYSPVVDVVKDDLGWSDNATYYRTIVIMLINTSEGIGSTGYHPDDRKSYSGSDLGEPYASMACTMVTANNTETSNLIRHEACGHAFGRLGDEYPGKDWDGSVNNDHSKGWYRNITVDTSLWNWDNFIGYDDVTYYQPNSTYWCPIDHTKSNSIMYNNLNKFNAVCRWLIYDRIRRQTEGARDYLDDFFDYDQRNR